MWSNRLHSFSWLDAPFPQKWVADPENQFFFIFLKNSALFEETDEWKKYAAPNLWLKKIILIFGVRTSLPFPNYSTKSLRDHIVFITDNSGGNFSEMCIIFKLFTSKPKRQIIWCYRNGRGEERTEFTF